MKILVANLGSTSFKYRLFDMTTEKVLARGGVERIGAPKSRSYARTERGEREMEVPVPDHAVAVEACLQLLVDPEIGVLQDPGELAGIGFKAVHAQQMTGVQRVDASVLNAMEAYNDVAPAHNPPYVRAMRLLSEKLPHIPLVAAFESGFHGAMPAAERLYAVPIEWAEKYGIKRWGFHGASHRYIGERTGQLLNKKAARVISCHLGGSSSLCAMVAGRSCANSLGMSPQSGLPHNNRVGDFDPFALPAIMRATGKSLEQVLSDLANRSGLLGLSGGHSNDLRDLEEQARLGDALSQQAIDVFVASVRHYLGAYLLLLNGADAIVFTGGIGENSPVIRAAVCDSLDWFGIVLDSRRNVDATKTGKKIAALADREQTAPPIAVGETASLRGAARKPPGSSIDKAQKPSNEPGKPSLTPGEAAIHGDTSRVQIWIMPTNEELIVARQAKDLLSRAGL